MKSAKTCLVWAVAGIAAGCMQEKADGDGNEGNVGTLHAALSSASPHDVVSVHYTVVEASQTCDDAALAETTVALESEDLPAGVQPSGGGDSHRFSDALFTLAPGSYRVCAEPLDANGAPSAACSAAEQVGTVFEASTTEILLVSQCDGDDSGGLDAITLLNDPPQIDDLSITPSKFIETCQAATLTVTASDPNGDAIASYSWSILSGSGTLVASGNSATFTASGAGDAEVQVTVTDVYGGTTSLTFPIHVSAAEGTCGSLQGIGVLPSEASYSYTNALDLSNDGTTITGYNYDGSTEEAIRFIDGVGLSSIGMPSGFLGTVGQGVSGDGSVIVGYGWDGMTNAALRWEEGSGWSILPLPSGFSYAYPMHVSGDGQVAVGYGYDGSGAQPVLWDSGGATTLGVATGMLYCYGYDTNSDGSVVVGYCYDSTMAHAFRWDSGPGYTLLPELVSGQPAYAFSVSVDGTTAGGYAFDGATYVPVLWSGGSAVALGDVPGGSAYGYVYAVNGDGTAAAGYSDNGTANGAMVWDSVNGIRSVYDVLAAAGVDVTGWTLTQASSISADGKVVAGYGSSPGGVGQGWIAHLP